MAQRTTGADILVQALTSAGVDCLYSLSGNHIMPVYDALLGSGLTLYHTRHEAAAVHMADCSARLSQTPGVALVTGGQGHSNAVAALPTALAAEAPLLLLSGHAPLSELGRGAFQEMPQADLAGPVCKASWTARTAEGLGHDIARAWSLALSGRPGPIHVSLPVDLLEANVADAVQHLPQTSDFARRPNHLATTDKAKVLKAVSMARRPLVLCGPSLCTPTGRQQCARAQAALGIPVIGMESPRGINDPSLGAFAQVLADADLIVLVGKPHDFTLRFAEPPIVSAKAELVVIDPDQAMLDRVAREKGARLVASAIADPDLALEALVAAKVGAQTMADAGWARTVAEVIAWRPESWAAPVSKPGAIHPLAIGRAVKPLLDADPDAVLVIDGGEIGQWAQAALPVHRRVINGVAGSIGAALLFALAARTQERKSPVIAIMGDGTFGFHMAEFDTAVRHDLPFVAIIGNDARWNAEHQIQLRSYGASRAYGCTLLPTRYDQVVSALGGHGELVTDEADLAPALARAIASGKPACLNVMIEGLPAPVIRRA